MGDCQRKRHKKYKKVGPDLTKVCIPVLMVRDERVPLCDSQLLLLRSRCLLCCSPADKDIAMKKEIEAAAAFLSQLAAGGGQTCAAVPEKSLAEFKQRLVDLLTLRFQVSCCLLTVVVWLLMLIINISSR